MDTVPANTINLARSLQAWTILVSKQVYRSEILLTCPRSTLKLIGFANERLYLSPKEKWHGRFTVTISMWADATLMLSVMIMGLFRCVPKRRCTVLLHQK